MADLGFDVSATMFDAARLYVGRDLIRLNIGGVHVHPHPVEGALIVATDGRRLVVVHDSDGTCARPVTVTVDKAMAVALKGCRGNERVTLNSGGFLAVSDVHYGLERAVMDTAFPNYARLIAGIVECVVARKNGPASFNGDYLADLAKVGRRLSNKRGAAVRVVTFGSDEAALTLWSSSPHAFGLLMPMRTNDVSAVPHFFRAVLNPPRKKRAPAKKRERV